MRSSDFMALAAELIDGGNEARFRTAVGRAYYGAFHSAKELLAAAGVVLPATAEAHRKIQLCFKESGIDAARQSGERLEVLRGRRNRADYDLGARDFRQRPTAESVLHVAQNVVAAIETLRSDPVWSVFRLNVRTYASQVLRLPISA
jgi:uncharacterized protein (UPF0332 family)